jgi:septal ring factor EnvC (AmiA/AmiB activator)
MNNTIQSIQAMAMSVNAAFLNASDNFAEHLKTQENVDILVDQLRLTVTVLIIGWALISMCSCCIDPCEDNLRRRLKLVESELAEAESTIADMDEENEKLKMELAKARQEITEVEFRYLSCRQAAQRFIDTPQDVPSGKRQRVDSK